MYFTIILFILSYVYKHFCITQIFKYNVKKKSFEIESFLVEVSSTTILKYSGFLHTESRIRNGLPWHHIIGKHRRDTLPSVRLLEPFFQLFEIPRSLLRRICFTLGIPPRRVVVFVVCHFGFSLCLRKKTNRFVSSIKYRGGCRCRFYQLQNCHPFVRHNSKTVTTAK